MYDTSEQYKIEEMMHKESIGRQTKDNLSTTNRSDWSSSKAGSTFVKHVMNKSGLVSLISDFMTPKAGPGRNHAVAHLLAKTGLDAETIAYLAVKGCVNYLSMYQKRKRLTRTGVSIRLGSIVHDEWRVIYFSDNGNRIQLLKKLIKDFDKRAYPKEWRKRTIQHYFDAEQLDWSGWDNGERAKVGIVLFTMFMSATGYCTLSPCSTYVDLTEEFVKEYTAMIERQAPTFMLYRPMVVPPRPWSVENNLIFGGGYLSKQAGRYPIVKGSRKADRDRLLAMDWSQVLPAINALQETPWRVCKPMLEAVEWTYFDLTSRKAQQGDWRGIGKLPCCEEESFPELPEDYHTNEEVKKVHNRIVFDIRNRRRTAKGRRINAVSVLSLAKSFQDYPKLYYPHDLDSRGRAYPVTAFLNPQGTDHVKALLEFADGKPVDAKALRWIAIAGANAFGKDKVSLEERVQWVHENEDMILSIARDYRHDHRWTEAGEPFSFLRFCFEWERYKREGQGYISHMVVPVDATCSGLQHYAAMLRCEELGKSVNLIPGYTRQDIYGDVAECVISLLMDDGASTEVIEYGNKDEPNRTITKAEIAKGWIAFGIDRKMTKRQVMVVPYAGKFSSCLEYTWEAFKEKMDAGLQPTWDVNDKAETNERVICLAQYIWAAIDARVERGKSAMQWLSKVAADYSKAQNELGTPIYERRLSWVTPDGFEVVQFRQEEKFKRIETTFEGRMTLGFYTGSGKLSPRDMALSVAPNFVHALDATHMRKTVIKALSVGIKDFAMIHDSFGVHACHMDQFATECIRPAFVEMYEQHDVLTEFANQAASVCETPSQPERGTLDIQGVLQSEFFFS